MKPLLKFCTSEFSTAVHNSLLQYFRNANDEKVRLVTDVQEATKTKQVENEY